MIESDPQIDQEIVSKEDYTIRNSVKKHKSVLNHYILVCKRD